MLDIEIIYSTILADPKVKLEKKNGGKKACVYLITE
jgi:hypothetical protein